jgi:hypothetical protein
VQWRVGHDHHLTGADLLRRQLLHLETRRKQDPARRGKDGGLAEDFEDVFVSNHRPEALARQALGPVHRVFATQLLPQRMRIMVDEKSRVGQSVIDIHASHLVIDTSTGDYLAINI